MGLLSAKLRSAERGTETRVGFWCPGCDEEHQVSVAGPNAIWGWDRNVDAPTFTPSVLITSGHYCSGQQGKDCWCTYEARFGRKAPFVCFRCHSFVRAGVIEFLGDCTHALAGQKVPLPDLPALRTAQT
ncbi:MAG: ammonia monooxygenase [Proteobacteria bacterium]|nr:ammonia monooxygenase [Pseudomonadota bacterium]